MMIESMFWGGLLRAAQAMLQSIPTLLVGLLVAGIFRRLLGPEGTRRLFASGTRRELPQAWLLGMLLPVCSLGVIPIAREMRRSGISGGTTLAFAMTAPLFNPLSLLYGLTLSEPWIIIGFSLCSLAVVTVVGSAWDRLFPGTSVQDPAPPTVAPGARRMLAVVVAAARELTGPSIGYIALGLLGVGLLGAALPPASLSTTMEHSNPLAPLEMAAVALPAYATPMVAMGQLGSMFQHANSPGAAFVLLTLGAGVNLGLVAWMIRVYGLRRGIAWLGILLCVVLGLAYAVESPLYPSGVTPAGHTHAFDIYCRLFGPETRDLARASISKLGEGFGPVERLGLTMLGFLGILGLSLRALDRRWRIEEWLERDPREAGEPTSWRDAAVPAPVLGGVALLGLVAFSVVGCYAYYPAPREVFEEMSILKGEVLTAALSGDRKHAEHFLPVWADWTRRLEVGVFLREGSLSPYRRAKAKVLRDRLELLKHAVEEGDRDESREYVSSVSRAHTRLRRAFLDGT
ncbi:MAG: permease [Isosphaeraceae bacterium]